MENVTENAPAEKAGETKAEKFVRLGEYRINKAIDAIGRIENLANRSAYDYTPEQVEAMFSVLESKVEEVKAKFTVKKAKENTALMNTETDTTENKFVKNIGFIFQSFQLVSELTVEQNIVFPLLLDYRKPKASDVEEILELLGLTDRRNHLPSQLSGGQQQRVAIGRELITKPK